MKATFQKFIIAIVAIGFIFGVSSCEKHTCPTYSQSNTTHTAVKA
jgi:hypothetical protein